jgi:hypothetical protein
MDPNIILKQWKTYAALLRYDNETESRPNPSVRARAMVNGSSFSLSLRFSVPQTDTSESYMFCSSCGVYDSSAANETMGAASLINPIGSN